MSLQSQFDSFVARVAERLSAIEARAGPLAQLDTSAQSDLVAAINELAARDLNGGQGVLHYQNVPASVWTLNHNLGLRPAVTVLDTGGNEVDAEIAHTHANQLVIRFARPLAGLARLI